MKTVGKGLLFLALLAMAAFCFAQFRGAYNQPDNRSRRFEDVEPAREPSPVVPVVAGTDTNAAAADTNLVSATNGVVAAIQPTNETAAAVPPGNPADLVRAGGRGTASGHSAAVPYLVGFVAALIGLAGLVGWEFTHWLATRASHGLGADIESVEEDPDYEAAEAEWTKGNHLDAINLLREYLQRNPSQQHVAIRIAEIYEKDLNNYLAAALELEDVLTKRLPREKWGWTAVHLANIYSGRLNHPEKAVVTLERIVADYPETAAAKKARQRLGVPEPDETPVGEMAAGELPPAGEPPLADEPQGNLPQGFRTKKH